MAEEPNAVVAMLASGRMSEPRLNSRNRSSVPARRAALRVLTREILESKAMAAKSLYEIGARLNRVNDEALFEAGGYARFGDYLEHEVAISTRNASRFMRIARHFNARIAARYGAGKLDAALHYMEVSPAKEEPGDLLSAEIRVRDPAGQFKNLTLHAATETEIRDATALVVEAKRGGLRIPKTVRHKSAALAKAMPPPPRGMARGNRVRLSRGSDGRLAATFAAIPLDELEEFLDAVREHMAG